MMWSILNPQERVILTLNAGLACALFVLMLVYAVIEPLLLVPLILFVMLFVVAYSAENEKPNKLDGGVVNLKLGMVILVWNLVFFALFFIAVLFVGDSEFIATTIVLLGGSMLGTAVFSELGRILARLR